jgi:hypothetical protein
MQKEVCKKTHNLYMPVNLDTTRVRNILIIDTKRGREQSVQHGHHEGKEHPDNGYKKE